MDRAHRLGQRKVVNVHRLIMRGTLEEKVMSLQRFKVSVANAVINAENSSLKTMNTDQLLDLFTSTPASRKVKPLEHFILPRRETSANNLILILSLPHTRHLSFHGARVMARVKIWRRNLVAKAWNPFLMGWMSFGISRSMLTSMISTSSLQSSMAEHRGSPARVQCKVNWDVRSRWFADFVANLKNFFVVW